MRTVMVFGTFDILHPGHMYFLRTARTYGDDLTVVIARDKTVESVKGRPPIFNELERLKRIEESKLADRVILGDLFNYHRAIQEHKPDVICLGYDQVRFTDRLSAAFPKIVIYRLDAYQPEKFKSSKFRDG